MSKILAAALAATGLTVQTGEAPTALYTRIYAAADGLDDAQFLAMGQPTMDWVNAVGDALINKLPPPSPPDTEATAATGRRRGGTTPAPTPAPSPEPEPEAQYDPEVGHVVKLANQRGAEFQGEVVEVTDEFVALRHDNGDELEYDWANVASIAQVLPPEPEPEPAPAATGRRRAGGTTTAPVVSNEPEVGDTLQVVTARGATIMGKLLEQTDTDIVLQDATGAEHELVKARLKSVTVKAKGSQPTAGAPAEASAPAATGRRRGGTAPTATETPATAPAGTRRVTRATNGGVSASSRMRELVCADPAMTKEGLIAKLAAEKLEANPNTVALTYAEIQKTIAELKRLGKLK